MDVPGATDLIAHFIARAVIDDILPPAFLKKLPQGTSSVFKPRTVIQQYPVMNGGSSVGKRAPARHMSGLSWLLEESRHLD